MKLNEIWKASIAKKLSTSRRDIKNISIEGQNSGIDDILLIDSVDGYQILDPKSLQPIWLTWPDRVPGTINRNSMWDGSWAVHVARVSEETAPYTVYWLYPYDNLLHAWQLNKNGERVG